MRLIRLWVTRPPRWTLGLELSVVLLVALAMRLAFLSVDPPILLTTDSLTYALPANHLANGQGFDLSLRRTPGYPLFLALIWTLAGDDFRPVAAVQHLLGVATAAVAWLLGRVAFGRLAGLLGGLAVALSGPQIIYEQYLMTEALFTLLLLVGTLTLVAGLRQLRVSGDARSGGRWFVATGVVFALCALTRPIGQIFPLFVPLGALFVVWRAGGQRTSGSAGPGLGAVLRVTLLSALAFALVVLPWVVRNRVVGGELTGSSALGKTLFGRITRHDDGFRFDLAPAGAAETDERRAAARIVAHQAAETDTSRGSLVHEQLMRDFGYTEAQAYNVMRDVALEIILAQPEYYVKSSLAGTWELFLGGVEPLRIHLERLTNERLRRDWSRHPELPALPDPILPGTRGRTVGLATQLVRIYEPSAPPFPVVLGAFFTLGAAAILLRPGWSPALVLPLLVLMVLVLSAFLDGPVPRFRYPLDPLIALTAAGGLAALVEATRRFVALMARGTGAAAKPAGQGEWSAGGDQPETAATADRRLPVTGRGT